jgi:hypothetical protein
MSKKAVPVIEVVEPEPDIKPRDLRAVRKEIAECAEQIENIETGDLEEVIKAEAVVSKAAAEDSAMHGYFEWDDTLAGHQYRLGQARALIRKMVVIMPDDQSEAMLPKYVSLRPDRKKPGGGYRETARVLNNKELLAELEETAKRDLDGILRRYEMLRDLCQRVRKAAGIGKATAKPKKTGKG